MFTLNGKYTNATIYTDNIDNETIGQIMYMINHLDFLEGSKIAIMPDCHAGKGCVVGTTMVIKDKIVPRFVGSDLGCGVLAVKLKQESLDLAELDNVIRAHVPHGYTLHAEDIKPLYDPEYDKLHAEISLNRTPRSLGTLGGGNHFIEIDKDNDGFLWLVIHTGSRHLGNEIAKYYNQVAANRYLSVSNKNYHPDFMYLEGQDFENYFEDVLIAQSFARQNRMLIAKTIMDNMHLDCYSFIETAHNYIDATVNDGIILRKGAVAAKLNEELVIPLNMRDGTLICTGRGNNEWNQSAPHGAGRAMKRSVAKDAISLDEYKDTMKGIYTTSVNQSTIDESPMAYKPAQEIIDCIRPTVTIKSVMKPIYNFKSSIN